MTTAVPGASAPTGAVNLPAAPSISDAAAAIKAQRKAAASRAPAGAAAPAAPAASPPQPRRPMLSVQSGVAPIVPGSEVPEGDPGEAPEGDETPPGGEAPDGDEIIGSEVLGDDFDDGGDDDGLATRTLTAEQLAEKFKVRSAGKVREVTLRDLIRDHAQVAESRRLAQEHGSRVAVIERAAEVYAGRLAELDKLLAAAAPKERTAAEWDQLFRTNPTEYFRERELASERQKQRELLAEEQRRSQEEQGKLKQSKLAEMAEEQARQLVARFPALADPEKAAKFQGEVQGYLQNSLGVTKEELAKIADHRIYVMAYKAMRFDAIRATKGKVQRKIESAPPVAVLRPGAPAPAASGAHVALKKAHAAVLKSKGRDSNEVAALIRAQREAGKRKR